MAQNFVPGLRQSHNCQIRRLRELPLAGKILVSEGQKVLPETIVAQAEIPGDVRILRIAETLGIEASDVAKGLQVSTGQRVGSGQNLCVHSGLFGWFQSRYASPIDGEIDYISEALGHVSIREPSQLLSVNAYCGGHVTKVLGQQAVEIETQATVIQGIFGIGGERQGRLHLLDLEAHEKITEKHFPASIAGLILVGGTSPSLSCIRAVIEGGAAGLIVGGIDDGVLKEALGYDIGLAVTGNENIPYSLIVTEGFGNLAISQRVLDLAAQRQGSFCCINGTTQIRAGAIRPEIIIPGASAETLKEQANIGLKIGGRVRLIRTPYFGLSGEIVDLPTELQKLDSGAEARVLKVKLDGSSEMVSVPRANAELL